MYEFHCDPLVGFSIIMIITDTARRQILGDCEKYYMRKNSWESLLLFIFNVILYVWIQEKHVLIESQTQTAPVYSYAYTILWIRGLCFGEW